jgi:hypothetical protein
MDSLRVSRVLVQKLKEEPPHIGSQMALIPQQTVFDWIKDVHADTDNKTGYLVKHPTGVYGKKVKELVRYFLSLSVEVKAIEQSRRIRVHPCFQYFFAILRFLSEFVFPVVFAVAASYTYYHHSAEEVAEIPNSAPSPPIEKGRDWVAAAAAIATAAGRRLGSTVRSIITVPVTFVANAVDRGLHLEEAATYVQTTGVKMLLLPVLFLSVYFLTKLLARLASHIYAMCAAHRRVWTLQQILLSETEEALERAIGGLLKPTMRTCYEQMLGVQRVTRSVAKQGQGALVLRDSVGTLVTTYTGSPALLRDSILDRLSGDIKAIPFAELVRIGQLSPIYAKTIHALIRHADEELSSTMFAFHEELSRLPDTVSSRLEDIRTRAADIGSRTVSASVEFGRGFLARPTEEQHEQQHQTSE